MLHSPDRVTRRRRGKPVSKIIKRRLILLIVLIGIVGSIVGIVLFVYRSYQVPKIDMVKVFLIALEELLSIKDQYYGQSGFYNALSSANLHVDDVAIVLNGRSLKNMYKGN